MKILNICKFDGAGCAWDLTRALRRHTHHKVRHVTMSEHKWRFGSDIITTDAKELRRWIEWADIVNCWGYSFRPLDTAGIPNPPNLIMTSVAGGYARRLKEYRGQYAKRGVKMLLHGDPLRAKLADAWLPLPIPVDEYALMKKKRGSKPVVCQTPSNLRRKGTDAIVKLLGNMPHIELLIVHDVVQQVSLEAKAGADIFIDQFGGVKIYDFVSLGGYGKGSLEAWAMGIPVIAHASEKLEEAYRETIGYLPYYESALDDLPKAVDALLDASVYAEYQDRGRRYIRTFHDDAVVARRFSDMCREIIG